MTIPQVLKERIEAARESLHPEPHYLEPKYRFAIYPEFGPRLEKGFFTPEPADTRGLRRRTHLGILVTRKVLPAWEKVRPMDDTPYRILDVIEGVMKGAVSEETASNFYQQSEERVEMLNSEYLERGGEYEKALCAGGTALHALMIAFTDISFDWEQTNYEDLEDKDLDPWTQDTSYYAWTAYGSCEPSQCMIENLEFWQWWLDEAVPAAYNSVPEPVER